ncbi:MAG: ATP-binding protein [Actinomycetota bacterium]|nr:ATP-binding protein [Actinomycetota bacterium]
MRLRLWMPLAAVLIVLLSVALMFLYGVPAVKARLTDYAESRTYAQAAAAADALSGTKEGNYSRELDLSADTTGAEILVVDTQGRVVARSGSARGFEPSREMLQTATGGSRMIETSEQLNVAVVPLVDEGILRGGVVFASGEPESTAYRLFLRSGLEAAGIASILGGGLMLLLGTLLSQRVERLALGARSIEGGDLSYRIEPGFKDELGELGETFNAMAARLEDSFSQLEEKSSTLDAIVNNLTEGVLATGLKGNVMFANRAARVMLGIHHGEALGKVPGPWKDFDLPEAVARCAAQRECGEAQVREAGIFLRVKVEHLPAFDEHRGGVLVVMQDLSEGRRLEARQERFLANAAHELKTPITTILGASDLLLSEDEEDPEVRRRFLKHIFTEAHRMQRLSETLLRLARVGWDLREPDLQIVDMGAAAGEAVYRMKPLAQSAGVELSLEGHGTRVRADGEWLEQALLVVVSNAVKYSGRGGQVRLRLEGGTVAVEDEGAGISAEDLPQVFDRFYQGADSSGGFGLGLSICKGLVERMEGEISIDSKEGIGTTVEIKLPEVQDD